LVFQIIRAISRRLQNYQDTKAKSIVESLHDHDDSKMKSTDKLPANHDKELSLALHEISGADGEKCIEGDCRAGFGTLVSENHKYVGEFRDGKFHGQGDLIVAEGQQRFIGTFEEGSLSEGIWIFEGSVTYKGYWKNGFPAGEGTLFYPDVKVVGTFVGGRLFQGELFFDNGTTYQGQLGETYVPHGKGTLTFPDGKVLTGQYYKGKFLGEPYEFSMKTEEEIQELRTMDYQQYLATSHWESVKRLAHSYYHYKCSECGSEKGLEVHHKTYEHRGNEEDYLDDLMLLCPVCHERSHGRSGATLTAFK